MPSKVAAYYTTDDKYRAVGSNHLDKIRYEESSLTLYITFYNGACYRYMGVPKHLYNGLMASPSHGDFFWDNIRQRFPYKLLGKIDKTKKTDILSSLSKGHKKLNELDNVEEAAKEQLKKREISSDEYHIALDLIERQRELASIVLDKEMGTYISPAQKRKEEKEQQENEANNLAVIEQNKQNQIRLFKKVGMIIAIMSTVVFTFNHLFVGMVVLGLLKEVWCKIE